MTKKREKSLGYVVNHLSRAMTQAMSDEIAALGVLPGQLPVLMCLFEQDGLSQRELYERVHIEQATMSNTLSRMERDGLVRRVRSETDRRQVHVFLTDYGAGLWRALVPEAETMLTLALAGINALEEETLRVLLRRVIQNVENCSCQSGTENPKGVQ